jgi:hypothetical protein
MAGCKYTSTAPQPETACAQGQKMFRNARDSGQQVLGHSGPVGMMHRILAGSEILTVSRIRRVSSEVCCHRGDRPHPYLPSNTFPTLPALPGVLDWQGWRRETHGACPGIS